MQPNRTVAGIVVTAAVGLAMAAPLLAQDPAAAERQYRIARRLAAEGSPEASAALKRVVELDPSGPLADDALVDQALLLGIPGWPEELGRLGDAARVAAARLLGEVLGTHGTADRAPEARYHQALLLLEPVSGRDSSRARLELLDVATDPRASQWGPRARYAVAWLDSVNSENGRARAALQRLIVDHPGGDAALRARIRLAILELRENRPGEAAVLLQRLVEAGAPRPAEAEELLEMAVRQVLREAGAGGNWVASGTVERSTGVRSSAGLARLPGGETVVGYRRDGKVARLGPSGDVRAAWAVTEPEALTVDPLGRIWVAADGRIVGLDDDGPAVRASLGKFGEVSALAGDATGILYALDRKGESIVRIDRDRDSAVPFWEGGGIRLSDLVFDGVRLLGVNDRDGALLEILPDASVRTAGAAAVSKPGPVAASPTGYVAVLDGKTDEVVLFGPQGDPVDRISTRQVGVSKPVALALGLDGSLEILDGSGGRLVRVP